MNRCTFTILLILSLIICGTGFAANVSNTSSGNWSNPNIWSPVGVPANNDVVTIISGTTVTVDVNSAAINSLIIESSAILHGDGTNKILMWGKGGGEDLTNNGVLDGSGAHAMTVKLNKSNQWGGSGAYNLSFIDINGKTLNFTAGANITLNLSGSPDPFLNPGTVNPGATLTIVYNGTAAQNISAATGVKFNNLSISNTAGVTLQKNLTGVGATPNFTGNLTVAGGGILNTSNGTTVFSITGAGGMTLSLAANSKMVIGSSAAAAGAFPTGFSTYSFDPASTLQYDNSSSVTQVISTIPTYGDILFTGNGAQRVNSGTLVLNGDWINNSIGTMTFTAPNTVVMGSASNTQTIDGFTNTNFNSLTINNSNGVALSVSTVVNGTLSMTSGLLNTRGNVIRVTSSGLVARTSGYVNGNLQRDVVIGSPNLTFDIGDSATYAPVSVAFHNVSIAGTITAKTTSGDHPDLGLSVLQPAKDVNRYWTLTNAGVSLVNYDPTFTFAVSDLDAGVNTATFVVESYNGSSWTMQSVGTRTGTSTQATGITGFGDFAIGDTCSPPSAANAGPDQEVCTTTATLAGNTPVIGTGTWSVMAGGATVTTPGSPTSEVTNLGAGQNIFLWTISNGVCTPTFDTVVIVRDLAPAIVTNPANQTICVGSDATFTAAASGSPAPTVQWQVSTDGGSTFNNLNGETNATLSFATTLNDNGYRYQAVFTNNCGTATTTAATLSISTPPSVATEPSNDTVVVGSNAAFSAAGSGNPTPSIQWQVSADGGVTFNNLAGDTAATLSFTAGIAENSYQYRAVFTNTCGTFTGSAATLTVRQAGTSVGLSSTPNPSSFEQPAVFTAKVAVQPPGSGNPTGSVSFYDGTNLLGSVPLAGDSARFTTSDLTAGSHTIKAIYLGDASFLADSTAITQDVNRSAPKLTLSSDLNPSHFEQNVTFTVHVDNSTHTPTGSATFYDGTTQLGVSALVGDSAAVSSATMSAGIHTIKVVYSGDSNFEADSTTLAQTVNLSTPTLTLISSLNPSTFEQNVTFTIHVTNSSHTPSGGVSFFDGVALLYDVPLHGDSATISTSNLAGGSHLIKAVYSGDSSFKSDSTTLTQTVNPATPAMTITSSLNPSNFEQNVTFTVHVDNSTHTPTGTVTFFDGTTSLGLFSLVGDSAQVSTASLAPATHVIKADYSGDANFKSDSVTMSQIVNQSGPTVRLTSNLNPSVYEQSVTFTAHVHNATYVPTGTITFYDGASDLGTIPLLADSAAVTTANLTGGTHIIKAIYSGDANFRSDSAALSQVVNRKPTTSHLTSSLNPSVYGQLVVLKDSVVGSIPDGGKAYFTVDGVVLDSSNLDAAGIASVSTSTLNVGTLQLQAFYGGTINFDTSRSGVIDQVVVPDTFTIVGTAGPHGSINPSGSVRVPRGSSQTFTFVPDTGYFVDSLHVDSVNVPTASQYTFTNVKANHTIEVQFARQSFVINAAAGSHGTITPSGAVPVYYGDSAVFAIHPDTGYYIADVHVDTISVGVVSSYTFRDVKANHSITATFGYINHPPVPGSLVAPVNRDTLRIDSLPSPFVFVWHAALDPDTADTMQYTVHVTGVGLDTSVTVRRDTTLDIDLAPKLQAVNTYLWTVTVNDGHVTVASPDTFAFTIRLATGVKEWRSNLPKVYALYQNYPNPFNPSTTIAYDIPRQSVVTLKVYNLLGSEVATLIDHRTVEQGAYSAIMNGANLASGVYFYRLEAKGVNGASFVSMKRFVLLK